MSRELDAQTRAEAVVDALGLLYHNDLDPDEFTLFPGNGGAAIAVEDDAAYWEATGDSRDGFACLVRTILSQNTSDAASQPAHEALLDRVLEEYGSADAFDAFVTDGDPEACPLADLCDRVGVDTLSGEVTDPARAD